MSKIQRFEDIIAWQKARTLTKSIYEITQSGPFGKDYDLKTQIRRAAVSIMSNIAEGYSGEVQRSSGNSCQLPRVPAPNSGLSCTSLQTSPI